MSVGSIQAGKCDVVLTGISPVDPVIYKIQGQTIGPGDVVLYDDTPVGPIHPNPPDMGVVPPVSPIQVSAGGILCLTGLVVV